MGSTVHYRFTGRAEGDLGSLAERGPSGPSPAMESRRRAIVDGPWTWLRQVHGARVVHVTQPGAEAGAEADAAVTTDPGAVLAVLTADCAPVMLSSAEGVRGVAHAGWRGLEAGVIGAAVAAMRDLGATDVTAVVGPCIHPCCYAFSATDLDRVALAVGDVVRSQTRDGQPALDLPAAVRASLVSAGAALPAGGDPAACTSCTTDGDGRPRWFSHRARGDDQRQALVTWCS